MIHDGAMSNRSKTRQLRGATGALVQYGVGRWDAVLDPNLYRSRGSPARILCNVACGAHGRHVGCDDEAILAALDDSLFGGVGNGHDGNARCEGNVSATE